MKASAGVESNGGEMALYVKSVPQVEDACGRGEIASVNGSENYAKPHLVLALSTSLALIGIILCAFSSIVDACPTN